MASPESDGHHSSPPAAGSNSDQSPQGTTSISSSAPMKRTRVLLSCHPCRSSKLKCDRTTPCGQCLKKGKPDACAYAPRREKAKPAKSMAARLKHLEGMVRGMVESEGAGTRVANGSDDSGQGQNTTGSVVHGDRAMNYVGGTHFMAILEDLEDLKAYFDDPEYPDVDDDDPYEHLGPSELLLLSRGAPQNKEELLAMLPDKNIMDRLMNRYFNSNSPSQHIIHVPTFTRQYNEFLKNRQAADVHWIATLFMILALGIFFSSFQAPHELEVDTAMPAMDRFRQYRGACGWALIWGKYSQPGPFTLQAMTLYTEADFLVNRVSQTNCYLLCATLIRLMLKMGLHRDPSKLPRITPYHGEMRRRMWNLAVQIDLLVAFHLGLPCMIHGIESDTELPRNLLDSDFNEDSTELPPSRPMTEYTPLTYAINKARIARGFGLVARLSHSLTLPAYTEVMRIDARIQEVWSSVPSFMMVKPLSECITDAPMLVVQRFGIASLYQKSRCVLHRRYLVDPRPQKEHDYSRRTCLEAAVALLNYQNTLFEATQPGAILAQNGWFIASLAINDFLLADMAVALAVQQQNDSEDSHGWMGTCTPPLTKESLIDMLKNSYDIWTKMAVTVADCRKAATVVRTMLRRIHTQLGTDPEDLNSPGVDGNIPAGLASSRNGKTTPMPMVTAMLDNVDTDGFFAEYQNSSSSHDSNDMSPSAHEFAGFGLADRSLNLYPMEGQLGSSAGNVANPWGIQNGYDWNQFDAMTRGPVDTVPQVPQMPPGLPSAHQSWLDQNNYNDFADFQASNSWYSFPNS